MKKTINTIRKEVKQLNFKLQIKTYSHGKVAHYCFNNGERMGNVFTKETLENLKPLLNYLDENKSILEKIGKEERIIGLYKI